MFFGWLKRYMPRSLYGRAALILVLPVITLQLAISVVFIQRHFDGVTEQMTKSVLVELEFLSETVEREEATVALVAAASVAEPLRLDVRLPVVDPPMGDAWAFYDLSGRAVIRTLRSGLGGVVAIDVTADRRVLLWVETRHGVMEVGFDRGRVSASNPHQLLVLMGVLGVLMTIVAYVFMRNQLRPIKRMAAAAAEYGKGRIVSYHPSGANEVRAAGNAFLDMRTRIERQTQQRTMMLSGVSHDLRTPLTRLKLGLSMMDDAEAEPLQRDVEEMQRMVDAFLNFARSDVDDALEEVDPVALVRAVVEDGVREGQAVSIVDEEGAGVVKLRALAIRRAMANLIGNALRYGSRAEVSVVLSERALVLCVEDDGPGIAAGDREEAVRPFVRLDPARNQDMGTGVGLGLAITSDIARGHGGVLRLGESTRLGGLKAELVLAR